MVMSILRFIVWLADKHFPTYILSCCFLGAALRWLLVANGSVETFFDPKIFWNLPL